MRIALVHDDLVQWGGAERVLAALSEIFPSAPIFTSVYDKDNYLLYQNFSSKKIVTSFIQKIPGWKNLYKSLLPFYPIAFEQFDFSGYDLVISQTTRFAKSIITKPQTKHICYCHTPPRFLCNFSGESNSILLQPYLNLLRVYDQVSSNRVDTWIAGSNNAKKRIKKVYQKDAQVIYPFVDFNKFSKAECFDGGYLLVISRLNNYKRADLAIQVAGELGIPLKIVGVGPEMGVLMSIASGQVEFLGKVDDETLISVIAGCKALIVASEEDFGLTPLEAQALGKPVIAYGKGGALESVISGETGYFFNQQTVESLKEALVRLDKRGYNQKKCLENAKRFSKENFIKNFQNLINSI